MGYIRDNAARIRPVRYVDLIPAIALPQLTSEAEMTTRPQSEPIEKGLSHRGLVQAAADGLVCNNQDWSVHNDTSWLEEVKMRIRAVLPAILVTGILAFTALTGSQAQAPSTLLIRGATIIDGLSDAHLLFLRVPCGLSGSCSGG